MSPLTKSGFGTKCGIAFQLFSWSLWMNPHDYLHLSTLYPTPKHNVDKNTLNKMYIDTKSCSVLTRHAHHSSEATSAKIIILDIQQKQGEEQERHHKKIMKIPTICRPLSILKRKLHICSLPTRKSIFAQSGCVILTNTTPFLPSLQLDKLIDSEKMGDQFIKKLHLNKCIDSDQNG